MNQVLCFPTKRFLHVGYTMRVCNGGVVNDFCVEIFGPLIKVDWFLLKF